MGKIILKNVRLSGNPDTEVVDDKNGINGKLNKMEDGRLFFIAELEDDDLFKRTKRSVVYSTNEKGQWQGANPKQFAAVIGQVVPDARVVSEAVMPYSIGEGDKARMVSTYSTIILAKENVVTVFNNAGHTLANDETMVSENTGEVFEKAQPTKIGG